MSLPIMPTRILLVGGGGREHAMAWKLASEPGVNLVVVVPGGDAIGELARVRCVPGGDPLDAQALVAIARREAVELAVIGPEAPLAAGIADALRAAGVPTFGPSAAAAEIESSKAFCRDVAMAAHVRMARGASFAELGPALALAEILTAGGGGVVVKADGLAAGKGVTVCDDADEAERALRPIFDRPVGAGTATKAALAVVEERLVGREASLIALSDGVVAVGLPAARDHKRLLDGDRGPNTGGMGAYSPVPDLPDGLADEILGTVHRPILAELARRGTPFVGALYAGLMLTADGPVLLECNARFGDPETQVILPRLAIALGPLLAAAARGALAEAVRGSGLSGGPLPVTSGAVVGIVLAAAGYPETPRTGDPIDGLAAAARHGRVVHAGTRQAADGTYLTNGGRVVALVGEGPDLASARAAAERAAEAVSFEGALRRRDIALTVPSPPPSPGRPAEPAGAAR
jgi:phosphoribosylamine---glycine ligase